MSLNKKYTWYKNTKYSPRRKRQKERKMLKRSKRKEERSLDVETPEEVLKPDYYKNEHGKDLLDFFKEKGEPEYYTGFLIYNIIKYRVRAGRKKGATKDLDKANHYMTLLHLKMEKYIENKIKEFHEFK